jgi:hypothetical protein
VYFSQIILVGLLSLIIDLSRSEFSDCEKGFWRQCWDSRLREIIKLEESKTYLLVAFKTCLVDDTQIVNVVGLFFPLSSFGTSFTQFAENRRSVAFLAFGVNYPTILFQLAGFYVYMS